MMPASNSIKKDVIVIIYTEEKIRTMCNVLKELTTEKLCDLTDFTYAPCGYTETDRPQTELPYAPFAPDTLLSGRDAHFWFHTEFTTPKAEEGKELYFQLLTGCEGEWDAQNPQGIVYLNGKMTQALDVNHTTVPLEPETHYDMYIYFYVGMHENSVRFLPSLCLLDTRVEQLYYDLWVPYRAALCFADYDDNYIKIMKSLDIALLHLDLRVPKSEDFYRSVEETRQYLHDEFYGKLCGGNGATISCIGHTHIDVAWLWTLAQTREKAQRSFSTVAALMKQYPEYQFMSSQPQLYKYVKQAAPELYEQIKELVAQGRWEVEGAMWLEADCNLTSGESLVRQILHGKRFMKEEFGVDSKILWLPDVFGYSAALPQILKKCGVDTFVTSKISWNETNKMPVDTFVWEGIDGSEVFTHFMTAKDAGERGQYSSWKSATYNGYIRPEQVLGTWQTLQQKDYQSKALITFGFGDGGGGPTKDMLEQQRRLEYGLPGLPKTKIEFAGDYIADIRQEFSENCKKLRRTPRWVGELYLEFHRGTYTSIAKNKKNNRKSELLLQKAETLCVTDSLLSGGAYPKQTLYDAWETVLLHQFHDIIPGSSIFEVYEDSDRDYQTIRQAGTAAAEGALAHIAGQVNTTGGLLVYNPAGFEADGYVETEDGKAYVSNVPAMGYAIVTPAPRSNSVTVDGRTIESPAYRLVLDENCNIVSLFDKEYGRELVQEGEAFCLQAYEDFPKEYDAWEISYYYKQKKWQIDEVVSCEPVFDGARAGLKIVKKFLDSTITQTIYLYEDSRRIDIENVIDWKQAHILLKAAFPTNIHTTQATYDIQFGHVARPTHENTSWDRAKFEVCAHKWADLSEYGYGLSILSDCKYGYNTEGSTIKLSLLKSATDPNPAADKHVHTFTYSLLPHNGDLYAAGVIQEAYKLNCPLEAVTLGAQEGTLPSRYSLVSCNKENIIIETAKQAENSEDIIVRMYEAYDSKCSATLTFGFDIAQAWLCDMLEQEEAELTAEGGSVTLPVKNFEIVTLKVRPKK